MKRRRNKLVLWEWRPDGQDDQNGHRKGQSKTGTKSLALLALGAGFLYFAWVYSATGIFTARRGNYAITAAEDPQ